MKITKEFAPITIKINTKEELASLKRLAHAAISGNEYFFQMFKRGRKDNPDWMDVAREILEL